MKLEKSIPVGQMHRMKSIPYTGKQKEKVEVKKEWLNKGGLTGVDQYIINRGI